MLMVDVVRGWLFISCGSMFPSYFSGLEDVWVLHEAYD